MFNKIKEWLNKPVHFGNKNSNSKSIYSEIEYLKDENALLRKENYKLNGELLTERKANKRYKALKNTLIVYIKGEG